MYFIKITDHNDNEHVISKSTTLETYIQDFKIISDSINKQNEFTLKVLPLGLELFKNETVINKGYIYNTTSSKKSLLYKLSLIKVDSDFISLFSINTQTQTQTIDDTQIENPLLEQIDGYSSNGYSSDEDIIFTKNSIPYDYSKCCYLTQTEKYNPFVFPEKTIWQQEPKKWDFELINELKFKLMQPNLGLNKNM